MNVVVTGGSGQLGTLILSNLIADRRAKKVVSLDLRPPSLVSPKLTSHELDIRDPELVRRFEGMDAVVHLAFIVMGPEPAEQMQAVNVGGSQAVFEAAAAAGVRSIVYASSLAAYGVVPGQPEPLLETEPLKRSPRLTYGDNKYDVEQLLDSFETRHREIRVVRMRPGILIGRRMSHVFGKLLARRVLLQVADAPMPVVWDEDVADAFSLALFGSARGVFNLVADEPESPAALARAAGLHLLRAPRASLELLTGWSQVLEQIGLRAPVDPGWLDAAGVRMIASSHKAVTELGWRRRAVTTADVMRRYAAEVPERLDPRILLFMAFVERGMRSLDPAELGDAARSDARIHLEISGRRGGDFDLRLAQGRARLKRGVPRPPTTIVRLSDDTFLDILAGTVDFTTAQLTGRLTLSGDPLGGWVMGAIVTSFRRSADAKGARGLVARGLGELLRLGRNAEGTRT